MILLNASSCLSSCLQDLLLLAGIACIYCSHVCRYEVDDDPGHVELVQNVIGRCLEKEDVCNEFYLQVQHSQRYLDHQLIKQTTDQPDPNSRINVSNWRFFALTLGVVVPRHKVLSFVIHFKAH